MSEEAIKAYQGQAFTVTLRSYGGTNYLWCLTTLPAEVVFAAVDRVSTATRPGAPVDTTFTFLAVKGGVVKIGFKLLCWSNPEQAANEAIINVNITPHNKAGGLNGFIRYSENTAFYNMPPYGFNGAAATVEKYGYPGCPANPPIKYGYPGCTEDPPVKYGYPGCVEDPPLKYGYPGCPEDPPIKYGYPGCVEDPPVKYGYPGCPEDPPVKYGYPGCDTGYLMTDYGYPGCVGDIPLVYGYPGCTASNPIVYYGYPGRTVKPPILYGYPGCADGTIIKYGYPGCR